MNEHSRIAFFLIWLVFFSYNQKAASKLIRTEN